MPPKEEEKSKTITGKAEKLKGIKVLDKIELPVEKEKPKPVASSDEKKKKRKKSKLQTKTAK